MEDLLKYIEKNRPTFGKKGEYYLPLLIPPETEELTEYEKVWFYIREQPVALIESVNFLFQLMLLQELTSNFQDKEKIRIRPSNKEDSSHLDWIIFAKTCFESYKKNKTNNNSHRSGSGSEAIFPGVLLYSDEDEYIDVRPRYIANICEYKENFLKLYGKFISFTEPVFYIEDIENVASKKRGRPFL